MLPASERTEREPLNAALARAGYQVDSIEPGSGGGERKIQPLRTATGLAVVGKICPKDRGQTEFANMQKLWQSSFGERRPAPGLPRPIEFLPEIGMLIMEGWKESRVAAAAGFSEESVEGAARLLAALHECDAQPELRRSSRGILRSVRRKTEQIAALAPQYRDSLQRVVERMEAARPKDSELVPSHGGSLAESIATGINGPVLLDWGRFQWADPCRDLASFGIATWKESLMRGRRPERWLLKRAITLYELARPGARIGKQLGFHVAASLLRLAGSLAESRAAELYLLPSLANLALRELE